MARTVSFSQNLPVHHGPRLIGLGLFVVLLAQVWPAVPIAAALATIGWGTTLTCLQGYGSRTLAAANLLVYYTLVALAASAQLNRDLGLLLVLDVCLAVVIGFAAARMICK